MRNKLTWIVIFGTAVAGCLNGDPLPNLPEAGPDEAGVDVGTQDDVDTDVDITQPCRECVDATCADKLAACRALAKCGAAIECVFIDQCFAKSAYFDLTQCGGACAGKAGIGSQTEPEVAPLLNLAGCGWPACISACGGMP